MARMSELVDALAAADGRRGSTTIANLARAGGEVGFTAATGVVTARQAADLLITTMVPLQAATRRETVAGAGQFRALHRLANQPFPGGLRVGTLGEALEGLILKAPLLDARTCIEFISTPLARIVFDAGRQIDFVATAEHPIGAGPFRRHRPSDLVIVTRCSQATLLALHAALGAV